MRRPTVALGCACVALVSACGRESPPAVEVESDASLQTVRLLITTDEHGWLMPFTDPETGAVLGGVAEAHAQMVEHDGLGAPHVGLFSNGDSWTGPHACTSLRGEPMVEAFNLMGYRGATLGNHDFDFGVEELANRAKEARFPLLGANVVAREGGKRPDWAEGATVLDLGGVRLGVVGLSNQVTAQLTHPDNVASIGFGIYADALRREVPRVRAQGAEHVLVMIHAGMDVVRELAPVLRELDVHLVAGGHEHESEVWLDDGGTPDDVSDDLVGCNGGPYLRSYCRIDVEYRGGRMSGRTVRIEQVSHAPTDSPTLDPGMVALLDAALLRSKNVGQGLLCVSSGRILRADAALPQYVVDAWLRGHPSATVSVTNEDAMRADLEAGPVLERDILSIMPFDNQLMLVDITGAQLREVLANRESVAGGVRYTFREQADSRTVVDLTDLQGQPIAPTARVRVIINDFMYLGGDGYRFQDYDPDPVVLDADWRSAVRQDLARLGRSGRPLAVTADDRARRID